MKPAWDKLAAEFKDSDSVTVADVDCTAAGKDLCSKVGVSGYPTIKYWLAGNRSPKDYQGGRDFDALKSFTSSTFKPACDPFTQKGCNDQEKRYIDKIKDKSVSDLEADKKTKEEEHKKIKSDHKEAEKEWKEKVKAHKKKDKALQKGIAILKKFIKAGGAKKEEL